MGTETVKRLILLCLISTFLLVTTGCQHLRDTHPEDRLYQDLGERKGIALIVEDVLFLIVDDSRINQQFRGIDVAQFQRNLTDQLCELSNGPCTYSGMNMREAHQGMNISATEFNALTEHLIVAMEKNGIATSAQNRLLKKIAPMHDDVRNL